MNIFVLDSDPKLCAQYHNDKHVVKMITEYAQILSTGLLDHFPALKIIKDNFYKNTHENHRCVQWVKNDITNFFWLVKLLESLLKEYHFRYGDDETKFIKAKGICNALIKLEGYQYRSEPKEFVVADGLCTPLPLSPTTAINSYRKYYIKDKEHLATWRKRGIPIWYNLIPNNYNPLNNPIGIAIEAGKKGKIITVRLNGIADGHETEFINIPIKLK